MADSSEQKPRRLWKVIFAVSLALNVAVIGVVAGVGFRFAGGKPPQAFEFGLGPIGMALTPEQRREIGRSLRRNPELRELGRSRSDGMIENVLEVLRAETFDPVALDQALAGARERARVLQSAAGAAFVAQVESMTPDERAAFADKLERASQQRRKP